MSIHRFWLSTIFVTNNSPHCYVPTDFDNLRYKMDDTLIDSLQNIHDETLHCEQDSLVIHNGIQVQLCHTIGKDAITPPNAPNKPDF